MFKLLTGTVRSWKQISGGIAETLMHQQVSRSNPESIYAHLRLYSIISKGLFCQSRTVLELSNPQASPAITPEAEIAIGCTELH